MRKSHFGHMQSHNCHHSSCRVKQLIKFVGQQNFCHTLIFCGQKVLRLLLMEPLIVRLMLSENIVMKNLKNSHRNHPLIAYTF